MLVCLSEAHRHNLCAPCEGSVGVRGSRRHTGWCGSDSHTQYLIITGGNINDRIQQSVLCVLISLYVPALSTLTLNVCLSLKMRRIDLLIIKVKNNKNNVTYRSTKQTQTTRMSANLSLITCLDSQLASEPDAVISSFIK